MSKQDPEWDTQPVPHIRAADAARPACLVQIHPSGPAAGRRHSLGARPVGIGRAEDCDIRTDEPSVSRRHVRIDPIDGGHAVVDLGSSNGTQVNDEPVREPRTLRDGDYLRVGNCIFRYLAVGNVEAEYHEEIYRLSIQDVLTRLPTRRSLDEFLAREVARSRRYFRPLSVVMMDVDLFKSVNDSHGHLCGDADLCELAVSLRVVVRTEDLCARYGGEEFALVLVETDHAGAMAVAEQGRATVAGRPFRFEGEALALTASAGVATIYGGTETTPADLLHAADRRLYAAKTLGRDRVVGEFSDGDASVSCRSTVE